MEFKRIPSNHMTTPLYSFASRVGRTAPSDSLMTQSRLDRPAQDRHGDHRLTILRKEEGAVLDGFADMVREGLTADPKWMSCRFLYDEEGSQLFEQICAQPEYYPTRTEERILRENAAEIARDTHPEVNLVELGSGNSQKTRILIEELLNRHGRLRYVPIDISSSMLEETSRSLLEDYRGLEIAGLAAEYEEGLHELRTSLEGPRLVLFLGSNIGNFDREAAREFLIRVRSDLDTEDRLLIGIDLRKDRATLEAAYDDAAGVTASFNLNLLKRINRELGGTFDLSRFRHRATYREERGRVEMHLDSLEDQRVHIEALELDVEFAKGEGIHTENSHKYSQREIEALAHDAGFELGKQWLDPAQLFSVNRFVPVA